MAYDMTTGKTAKHLIKFAIPLVLGNIFQLTYNAVDSIIVGRFVGKDALASVGTANPIMNIITFFIIGICLGSSVLMSEFYGKGDLKTFKQEVSTAMIAGLLFTVSILFVCVIFARPLLMLIRTPNEILEEAAGYLRILFSGLLFIFLYNFYSSTLRSIGDTKTPLLFLIISSSLNVLFDLLFVVGFRMGVRGAALATILAQGICVLLCIGYVKKKIPLLHFSKNDIVFKKDLLKKTLSYSFVTAMQQSCLYIGKVLVQSAVNPLGVDTIASFNAVNRIDDFAFTPQQNIGHAMTTFTAQNRGANKNDRIHKGFMVGMKMETVYWLLIAVPVFFGAEFLMRLFVPKEGSEVIKLGVTYLRMMAFFYILPSLTNGIQGYFRGMGKMKVTLMATFCQMAGRVFFAYLLAPRYGIVGIAISCCLGWIVMLSYELPVLIRHKKSMAST